MSKFWGDPLHLDRTYNPLRDSPQFDALLTILGGLDYDQDPFKLEAIANNHRPNTERAKVKAGRRARLKMQRRP